MTCQTMQRRMAGVLTGAGRGRERLDVEAHARVCARCADAFRDLAATSVAIDRAYAPYRGATVALSPARVRLALRAPVPTPAGVRLGRLSARLSEVALAAAVTAFAFVGSASVAPKPAIVDEAMSDAPTHVTARGDDQNFIRWFRTGRYAAPQDLVDPAVAPAPQVDEAISRIAQERVGLAR